MEVFELNQPYQLKVEEYFIDNKCFYMSSLTSTGWSEVFKYIQNRIIKSQSIGPASVMNKAPCVQTVIKYNKKLLFSNNFCPR